MRTEVGLVQLKTANLNSMIAKFQNFHKTDIPYIVVEVQGKPLNMIVDTGCGMSIIEKKALKGLKYTVSPRNISLSALNFEGYIACMCFI